MKLDKGMQIWFGAVIAYILASGVAALAISGAIVLAVLLYFGVV